MFLLTFIFSNRLSRLKISVFFLSPDKFFSSVDNYIMLKLSVCIWLGYCILLWEFVGESTPTVIR